MDVLKDGWKDLYKNFYGKDIKYAEDDVLLNDWVDKIEHRLSWHLFDRNFLCNTPRKEIVDAKGRKVAVPTLRDEDVDVMLQQLNEELSWLRGYIIKDMLYRYATEGEIELDEDVIWRWFPDAFKYED